MNNTKPFRMGSLVCLMMLFVSGCNSLQINDANQALSNHFTAKTNATAAKDFMLANSVRAALQDLANETQTAGDKQSDVLNKITFYQISATAAWQSNLLVASDYAKKGQQLCEQEEAAKQMPVHCGMLAFIPLFALNDMHTLRASSIQKQIENAAMGSEEMLALRNESEQMFKDYRVAISAAVAAKRKVATYKLSEDAILQINRNLDILACTNLARMNDIFSFAGGANIPNRELIKASIDELSQVVDLSCG